MTRRCLRRTVFTALLGASAAGGSAAAQCVETTLTSPAAATNDYARSVAVTDDLVIVGDPRLDEPGRVLVYSLAEGGWAYETTLLSAAAFAGDQFGYAVAAAGNLVVVGVYAADVTGFSSGAVHVYRRLGATWALEDQLAPSDGDMGDRFGWAVSTDGERVLVGARSDENDGLLGSGSAYVFRHTGDGWLEEAKLTDPNRAANDAFGFSVSLAGTTALVGASGDDDPGLDSGAAHVFRHVGIGWVHEAELEATDAEGQERFGRAVALAANIAVVGASHDGDDGTHSGSAYVYRRGPEGWTEDRKLTASDAAAGARFGRAVSIAPVGDLVVIGAPSAGAVGSGAAYLFADHGGKWSEVAKFAPYADVSGAQFGTSTAAASGRAVVGAPRGSEDPGTVDVILTEPGACPSIGDLNGDGRVSFADLLMLAGAWGACPPIPAPCAADLNGDGIVSGTDLLMLLSRWTR